jgi:hypothetical protein
MEDAITSRSQFVADRDRFLYNRLNLPTCKGSAGDASNNQEFFADRS